jgi:hypothetical protein
VGADSRLGDPRARRRDICLSGPIRRTRDPVQAGRTIPELDLAMFTTAISATLNWIATRIKIALTSRDDERRDLAAPEVPGLLAKPPSRKRYELISARFACAGRPSRR